MPATSLLGKHDRGSFDVPVGALQPPHDKFQYVLPRNLAATVVPRGRALFWQDERQTHKIDILQGVVRAVRLLENGNRQILAFYWPGDTVYPSRSACQQFTAEAVTNCRIVCCAVSNPCRQSEPCGVQQVFADTLTLVTTIGQLSIQQRIAWFLLRIRRHLPHDRRFAQAFQILIPRADIADHLGTSMETVCRTLADFRDKRLIDLPNRKTIRYIDIPGLTQVVGD
jgi:CRP-like cAMP-binding protein